MFCPNCGRNLPEGTKFCGGCGTRLAVSVEQPTEQPVQKPLEQPVQYTEPVFDPPIPAAAPAEKEKKTNPDAAKILEKGKNLIKKIPAKYLKIGGIALAALVVVIVVVSVLAGGSSGNAVSAQPDGALYLKDGQLYYSDFSKKAPYELTDDLLDDASNAALRSYASAVSDSIHVTGDGSTMFYLDKIGSDGTGTLYYRSLTNFKKEPTKIAANVSRYTVSEDGKLVTFLKGGTLYQFNMKEETKIKKDITSYRVSSDGKILYYKNSDGTWYVMKNGEDEKIGSDISIEYITEDYATVYYTSDDKLYKKTIGKDKEKLMSDLEEISDIGEDGTFYYAAIEELPLSDFFIEDTDEYDGLMEMLAEETLQLYEIGYYNGKEGNIIGESCSDTGMEGDILYYMQYDVGAVAGTTFTALVEYYYNSEHYYIGDAARELVNDQLMATETTYIAVNGTTSVLEVEALSDLIVSQDGKTVYALCDVDAETAEGTLYQVTLSGDKVKSVEEYADGVYSSRGGYYASFYGEEYSSYLIYFKDVQDDHGDLYANGTLVDSDVYTRYTIRYNPDNKTLVYYADYDYDASTGTLKTWNGKGITEVYDDVYSYSITDSGDLLVRYDETEDAYTLAVWNGSSLTEITDEACLYAELENGDLLIGTDYSSKNYSRTLSLWNGKKLTEISEDVYDYTIMPNGDILYLYDYSTSKYEGELYLWNGKKSELVDEDVAALIVLPCTVTHYFD